MNEKHLPGILYKYRCERRLSRERCNAKRRQQKYRRSLRVTFKPINEPYSQLLNTPTRTNHNVILNYVQEDYVDDEQQQNIIADADEICNQAFIADEDLDSCNIHYEDYSCKTICSTVSVNNVSEVTLSDDLEENEEVNKLSKLYRFPNNLIYKLAMFIRAANMNKKKYQSTFKYYARIFQHVSYSINS
ncbi:unnamed protein product [Rotaria sp. Silwood2]|nr:unnamed protein product [Rotaria sp. Silwood2]CAF2732757.1 unnamed protein product [Rotaria sp. Silwood2]CAF2994473.1 unnamed protein product [Rotaria sp. Silwood2]CAF3147646.1 unnamed protein product [Rotaria sp. Silwood2]CAF4385662.1 unnamed protein product [Rotaria sp. Silwood2]